MPNIKSAKKRMKQNEVRKIQNKAQMSGMRTAVKKAKTDVKEENVTNAIKLLDKAVNKGLIKKNRASRNKSKLMKSLNEVK